MAKISKTQEAMRELGRAGGKANVRKNGKDHMAKISNDYWNPKKKKGEPGKTKRSN